MDLIIDQYGREDIKQLNKLLDLLYKLEGFFRVKNKLTEEEQKKCADILDKYGAIARNRYRFFLSGKNIRDRYHGNRICADPAAMISNSFIAPIADQIHFLKKLQMMTTEKGNCFISYAWPTEGNQGEEYHSNKRVAQYQIALERAFETVSFLK